MDFNLQLDRADTAIKKSESLIQQEANSPHNKKSTKDRMGKVLSSLQQVTAVLEGLAELHPIAKSVVVSFKAILKLEVDRRETNEQIVTVCHFMGTMVYSLRYLHTVISGGGELNDEIEGEMNGMIETMTAFGDFADLYYNRCSSKIVRLLRSADFKNRLHDFTVSFNGHQTKIEFFLNIRQAGVQNQILQDVQKIVSRLGNPNTPAETQAQEVIHQCQGVHNVIADDASIRKIAQALKEPITSSTLSAIRDDLDYLLHQNWASFELKLNGAQMEITEAIERSSERILRRLDEGPHDLIKDPDIKEIWKANGWKLSVKCRHFVDALCNHYNIKFARDSQDNGGVRPPDEWTLRVLSKVNNHAAIGEAVDEDSSGFLSVYEMNRFLSKKPADWSTPSWFTYWAIGWQLANILYTLSVDALLDEIEEGCNKIKSTINNEDLDDVVDEYMVTIKLIRYIVQWLASLNGGSSGLEDIELEDDAGTQAAIETLAEKYTDEQEKSMTEHLSTINFAVSDPAFLPSITGKTNVRIEQVIMILLHLLLQHQRDVILGGGHSAADAQDFASAWQSMDMSLTMFVFTFHHRMKALLRSWRSLKLDVQIEIHCFAGGLFTGWYDEYIRPGSDIRRLVEEEEEEEGETVPSIDPSASGLPIDEVIRDLHTRVDSMDTRIVSIESMLKQLLTSMGQTPPPPAVPPTTQGQSHEAAATGTRGIAPGADVAPGTRSIISPAPSPPPSPPPADTADDDDEEQPDDETGEEQHPYHPSQSYEGQPAYNAGYGGAGYGGQQQYGGYPDQQGGYQGQAGQYQNQAGGYQNPGGYNAGYGGGNQYQGSYGGYNPGY